MKLMNVMNATGKANFMQTKLNGQVVLRISIGQTNTDEKHVKATWELIQKMAKELE
jgi:aromatic-L-amino-acid decarboxylase